MNAKGDHVANQCEVLMAFDKWILPNGKTNSKSVVWVGYKYQGTLEIVNAACSKSKSKYFGKRIFRKKKSRLLKIFANSRNNGVFGQKLGKAKYIC